MTAINSPVKNPFPLLPLRNGVLFPGTAVTVPVGRRQSKAMMADLSTGDIVGVGVQRDPRVLDPGVSELHALGVWARVERITKSGNGNYQLVLRGLGRFHLDGLVADHPYWRADGHVAPDVIEDERETRVLAELLQEKLEEHQPAISDELRRLIGSRLGPDQPGELADAVAGALGLGVDREVEVLMALEVGARLRLVHRLIGEAEELAGIKTRVAREVQGELGKAQREVLLRQQLRAIQKELGEGEDGDDLEKLRVKLDEAGLSDEARETVDRELGRLEAMGPSQSESHVIRNYLEFVGDLPWSKRVEASEDLNAVAAKLDEDHYGLEEPKKRILEHLAVKQRTHDQRGAILCFAGPPGVGKTSLGHSIGEATGRPLIRVALGGIRDEAEIRGHRRTYVGAMAGRILKALGRAKVKNPILLLDEIDKLGVGFMGSPEAALLEVLDPEQNHTFADHYLELPFDLSEVMFICTANSLETLSPPLRDRLEVVELHGYTREEKRHIARGHLLPEQLERHGLADSSLRIEDDALESLIKSYTREAGVRQLKRELGRICRAVTLELARGEPEGKAHRITVGSAELVGYLGREKFWSEIAERTAAPGVATGLAWTPVGGDILFIETSRMPGKGRTQITGQLGDVMQESAKAALSYIRSHADALGVDADFLESQDLHIHVPAGGIPKDGPSAGVTIFTALTSLLTGKRVRADTAMTGECTLRGRVLPVGGIKSKVLAAHAAGIKRIILPARCERDLDELPRQAREALTFIFVEEMGEVLAAALEDARDLDGEDLGQPHKVDTKASVAAGASIAG